MNKYEEMFGTPQTIHRKGPADQHDEKMLEAVKKIGKVLSGNEIDFVLSTLLTMLSRVLKSIEDLELRQFIAKGVLKGVMDMVTHFAVNPIEDGKNDKA